jgi:hypothetical protein
VRRHDDSCAAGDAGFDALRQIAPRKLVHAGERLVEQQQSGIPHPCPREEHAPQLAIGQLAQAPRRK